MTAKSKPTATAWIDPDDAPELTDAFFERADQFQGKVLVRRGRPAGTATKESTTVRFDKEVLDAFRAAGPGWQTRMNAALREWLRTHPDSR
ncbi:MAG: hypothetical protein BWZ07_02814 [Alphaproteobacteria bacterium ADurb.BinA280]|jgi:uncharacterized protein (DUF4415 family)|uniref:BrnA antitoxin family protein n=1 Tax=Dokdonella sp. TaxID=2291710 RepID=UPI0009C4C61A|nr:BrnA antitoxin family protein [Dokdonella sp.]MCC6440519.1 BrnA antitoxin family protein [Rhodanobacteraceae bacterium]OPZ10130.1 MAG: hypothetical protein BWZ07_02814 [Alphaproteobacteria bacterium ADurb.BinA280]MBK8123554.1 BrnA antitoxin family protein [Dokdonella sp.]MBP6327099.1 BrnA antitoxin family protein [Dokdonella sp.]MBP6329670.1 BrnA antitoxin family protein [Dokdonella sp.]